LINDPDIDDFEKLIYTMHQMYAHHQATLLGLRSFVSIAVYQPSNFSELNEMQVLIQEKMLNLLRDGQPNEEPEIPSIPEKTALLANFPNPFNPITTISFDLAVDSIVSIDIFNIRGQRVKTVTNEHFGAGSHNVEWNGTDENGRSVGSGIYFYRMVSGDFTDVKRMVLLK
ncbi:MAG: T9SS type A sorting domain-containing protein, partial [Candidatus Cloacimonetes bacterium]|nr:T9SS type A sorting domain-containing protein [Candidatus Cloacimonadota bacterium]